MDWDIFISHAWEDKEAFARPLARALEAKGLRVWFDEFTLTVGDSLRRSIDRGLANSRYGVVILSPYFFAKEWPQRELDGLVSRESDGEKVILPIWHDITRVQVERYSPLLAGRLAALSSRGVEQVVGELLRAIYRDSRPMVAPPRTGSLSDLLTIEFPIHLDLVCVPAGEFLMGSDPQVDQDAEADEQPQHRLYLPDFYIGKYPVTNEQYAAFVKTGRQDTPKHWEKGEIPAGKGDHPVVDVSWQDAVAFCWWLSRASGKAIRLPTEAEWEKAARGSDGRIYPWGNDPPTKKLYNFGDYDSGTTPVGQYPAGASPCGALDMAGNVYEWTSSLWGDLPSKPEFGYPYDVKDGRENLSTPNAVLRVVRGGSWGEIQRYTRCAYRYKCSSNFSFRTGIGFRVVVSLSASGL